MSQSTAEDLPRLPRRTEQAVAQIDAARAEPTSAEIEAEMRDTGLHVGDYQSTYRGIDPTPPDSITLSGAKLLAYRQLEAAAVAAHDAQQSMTATGVALREAIQAMCAAMTGAK